MGVCISQHSQRASGVGPIFTQVWEIFIEWAKLNRISVFCKLSYDDAAYPFPLCIANQCFSSQTGRSLRQNACSSKQIQSKLLVSKQTTRYRDLRTPYPESECATKSKNPLDSRLFLFQISINPNVIISERTCGINLSQLQIKVIKFASSRLARPTRRPVSVSRATCRAHA